MSRRGRAREVAISLFSFQDIITSVTAIMILLVLILSLELVSRVPGRQVSAEDRQTAADLHRSLDRLQASISAINRDVSSMKKSANEIAAFDAEETQSRTAAAKREFQACRSQIRSITLQISESRSEQRDAEHRLHGRSVAARFRSYPRSRRPRKGPMRLKLQTAARSSVRSGNDSVWRPSPAGPRGLYLMRRLRTDVRLSCLTCRSEDSSDSTLRTARSCDWEACDSVFRVGWADGSHRSTVSIATSSSYCDHPGSIPTKP